MTARTTPWALVLLLAACGTAREDGGDEPSEALDIDVASSTEGLRASTVIDGETIQIEARTVIEPGTTSDGKPYDDEVLVAAITGQDGTTYVDWRLRVLFDELTGTIAGAPFADALAQPAGEPGAREEGSVAAPRSARPAGPIRSASDWAAAASGRTGVVLSEVSRRAGVTIESGAAPDAEDLLGLVAQAGPFLQALPSMVVDTEAVCGDRQCTGDETDGNCPEDCGCAAEEACGGVAPFGCYCGDDCAANGDCCVDACQTCGAGCPPCGEVQPCGSSCTTVANACDGQSQCPDGEDEAQCNAGACRAGQLACDDGSCLELYQFCDGTADCAGGEDETCECAYCTPG